MCRCECVVGLAFERKNTSLWHAVRSCQYAMGLITSEASIIQFSTCVANQANSNNGMQGCVANTARVNYTPPDSAEQCCGMGENGTGVVRLPRHRRPGVLGQMSRRVATKRPSRTVHQYVSVRRPAMLHPRCRSCKTCAVCRVSGWSGPHTRCWMARVSTSKASASTALPCCLERA